MSIRAPRRILFTTFDGGGNVAPIMAVVSKLVQRGHFETVIEIGCQHGSDEIVYFVPDMGAGLSPPRRTHLGRGRNWMRRNVLFHAAVRRRDFLPS